MQFIQTYQLKELNDREQQLLSRIYSYLKGDFEQKEKGLEWLTENIEKQPFCDFLLKVKPNVYTECFYSTDCDIINSTFNFIMTLCENEILFNHLVEYENEFPQKMINHLKCDETRTMAFHFISQVIDKANELDSDLLNGSHSNEKFEHLGKFTEMIPFFLNHLETFDDFEMTSYHCLLNLVDN